MGTRDLVDSASDAKRERSTSRKGAEPARDFATELFTGDLFNELSGPLPILTLDVEPIEDDDEIDQVPSDGSSQPLYGVSQPAYQRVRLEAGRVRADVITMNSAKAVPGHVVDASLDGLLIRLEEPVSIPSQDIDILMGIAGGLEMKFQARLIRNSDTSLSLHYEASDTSLRFRLRFLSEAMTRTDQPPFVRIESRRTEMPRPPGDPQAKGLAILWSRVLEDFADDARHQAFLTNCIEHQQLSYALERYRVYKRDNPDADVDAYLKQIGTILGFYALQRASPEDSTSPDARKKMFWLLIVIFITLVAFYMAAELLGRRTESPPLRQSGQF